MIYISLVMVLIFFEIINIFTEGSFKIVRKLILIVFMIVLILIAGTRNEIGYDYFSYENIFNIIKLDGSSFLNTDIEKGYYLINKISYNFNTVLFLSAVICVTTKIYMINKCNGYIYTALALYISTIFMTYDMGVLRQGIAISIVMLSINYIKNREFKKFIICIMIAMLFHISAMIFLPTYLIVNKDIRRRNIYLVVAICFIIGISNFSQVIFYLGNNVFSGVLSEKLNFYYLSSYNTSTFSITSLKRLVLLIFFVEFIKRNYRNDILKNIYLNIYFLGCCIYYSLKGFGLFSDRGSAYYNCIEILIFSIIIKGTKSKLRKVILILIIVVYCLYNINATIKAGAETMQLYTPYNSTLFK